MQYFYENKENEQAGPVNVKELAKLYREKELDENTLIWFGGLLDWTPLNESVLWSQFKKFNNEKRDKKNPQAAKVKGTPPNKLPSPEHSHDGAPDDADTQQDGGSSQRRPIKKSHWTEKEDNLLRLLAVQCDKNWKEVSDALLADYGIKRDSGSCRRRWTDRVNPEIDNANWTEEMNAALRAAHEEHGNNWSEIKKGFLSYSERQLKAHWTVLTGEELEEEEPKKKSRKPRRKTELTALEAMYTRTEGTEGDLEEKERPEARSKPKAKRPAKKEAVGGNEDDKGVAIASNGKRKAAAAGTGDGEPSSAVKRAVAKKRVRPAAAKERITTTKRGSSLSPTLSADKTSNSEGNNDGDASGDDSSDSSGSSTTDSGSSSTSASDIEGGYGTDASEDSTAIIFEGISPTFYSQPNRRRSGGPAFSAFVGIGGVMGFGAFSGNNSNSNSNSVGQPCQAAIAAAAGNLKIDGDLKFRNRKTYWTESEDETMLQIIAEVGHNNWATVAERLRAIHGTHRDGGGCKRRWVNNLCPATVKTPWSKEEDEILLKAQAEMGNRWIDISKLLPGRTDRQVNSHWLVLMNKTDVQGEDGDRVSVDSD